MFKSSHLFLVATAIGKAGAFSFNPIPGTRAVHPARLKERFRLPTSLNPYQLNDIVSRWNSSRGRALGRRNDQHFSFLPMRTSCRRLDSASISTTIRSTAFSFVACVTFVFVVGIGVLDDLRCRPQEVLELLDAFAIPANIVKHPLFVMRFVPTGLFQVLNKLITVLPLTFRA